MDGAAGCIGIQSSLVLDTLAVEAQRPLSGNARSTVGTITDVAPMLRALFARYGDGALGKPSLYSFNDPEGMCPACDGLGQALQVDPERLGASGEVYVLDEPTTGLHLAVIAKADHVIDLGPGGGREGGRIVATGTPAELAAVTGSRTGEHLRRYLSA